jgi:hypothetical protein
MMRIVKLIRSFPPYPRSIDASRTDGGVDISHGPDTIDFVFLGMVLDQSFPIHGCYY